ncbi:MAG: MotA/TolQ/ExbB proton channel family protein [Clostridia bacterium]|nr:MotA/TolQ/ExbB proton channel family protein [Clostridia bacterium]
MKRTTLIVGFFFVIICGLMIVFSPDSLSMIFVIVQSLLMLLGYVFGIYRVSRFSNGFNIGRQTIKHTQDEIQSDEVWIPLSRNESIFQNDALDKDFDEYRKLVAKRKANPNATLPDIENVFNEDSISIKIWRGAINQIPETLTSIGILGTFVGLIIGVGSIGFSSVAAAVTSLKTLIDGIEIAFYTSIVGIILSICFNLIYKFFWNILIKDMYLFVDDFHKNVIPSEEEQMRELQSKYYLTMLRQCEEHNE